MSATTVKLGNTAALEGLTSGELQKLESIAGEWRYDEGQTIFRQDEDAYGLCVVLGGKVGLHMQVGDESVALDVVGPGDLVGWSALVAQQTFTSTAVALEPSELAVFKFRDIQRLTEAEPHLGCTLMTNVANIISNRLRETQQRLAPLLS